MPDLDTALSWVGQRIDDVYGARLGKVEDVYVDESSGEPVWLAVRVGRFGDVHLPVPTAGAVPGEGGIWVPHERQVVRSAGALAPGEPLGRERSHALAGHYELPGEPGATRPAVAWEPARHA